MMASQLTCMAFVLNENSSQSVKSRKDIENNLHVVAKRNNKILLSILMLIFNLGGVLVNHCKNLIVTYTQGGLLVMFLPPAVLPVSKISMLAAPEFDRFFTI